MKSKYVQLYLKKGKRTMIIIVKQNFKIIGTKINKGAYGEAIYGIRQYYSLKKSRDELLHYFRRKNWNFF